MAAPWRVWVSGLLSVPRFHSVRRPLQNGVPRDVLLFQHERGRFFAILGLFCAGQGIFWTSLAVVALSRPPNRVPAEAPNRGYMDLGCALWRYGLAVGCGAMDTIDQDLPLTEDQATEALGPFSAFNNGDGTLVLGAGLLYSLRSVRSVMLLAGGQQVMLTTYAPFALGNRFIVPLNQISCMAHRGEVPAMLPLKVKGRRFYFLLDKAGHFPNTHLFDNTVGAYRSL